MACTNTLNKATTQQQVHKELLQDLQQVWLRSPTTQQQAHKELLQDLPTKYPQQV